MYIHTCCHEPLNVQVPGKLSFQVSLCIYYNYVYNVFSVFVYSQSRECVLAVDCAELVVYATWSDIVHNVCVLIAGGLWRHQLPVVKSALGYGRESS